MKTVHKIKIPIGDAVVVEMPHAARIVHISFQFPADEHLTVWYERDFAPSKEKVEYRTFITVPTGAGYTENGIHRGTAISAGGYYVLHLIEAMI